MSKESLDENLPIRLPPRSILNVCGFLWVFEKEKVFPHNIVTSDDLMRIIADIEEELLLIPQQFFNNVYSELCVGHLYKYINIIWTLFKIGMSSLG